jgi:hypothetical protein
LLALGLGIRHRHRGGWDHGRRLNDGHNGGQAGFGRDPNHGIQESLARREHRASLGLAEAPALAGGEDRARDRNGELGGWLRHVYLVKAE